MHNKLKAFVLKKTRYGEADLILQLLSSEGSVFSAIAKSALKSKKRFGGGVLDPTHYISLSLQSKSSGEGRLPVISEAQLISEFEGLRTDYDKLELSFYFIKLILKVGQEDDYQGVGLFDLFGNSLVALAASSGELEKLKLLFELKFLQQQGVLSSEIVPQEVFRLNIRDFSHLPLSASDLKTAKNRVSYELNNYLEAYSDQL